MTRNRAYGKLTFGEDARRDPPKDWDEVRREYEWLLANGSDHERAARALGYDKPDTLRTLLLKNTNPNQGGITSHGKGEAVRERQAGNGGTGQGAGSTA